MSLNKPITEDHVRRALKAWVQVLLALAEAIKELGKVPSGHLYARLMGLLPIEQYQQTIADLAKAGLIKVSNSLITWVGSEPAKTEGAK